MEKLPLKPLNRQTAASTPLYPEKIIQFGGGNFLRAFTDWVIDILNEKTNLSAGVVVIKPTPGGDYTELTAQDGLFHVHLTGYQQGQLLTDTRLITCINRNLNPYTNFDDYLALAQQPAVRFIFSNTTEAGIVFDPADRPHDCPARSFPAKLTQFLYHRYRHFNGDPTKGCLIIPCELIEQNGDRLREIMLAYAAHWQLEPAYQEWLLAANAFFNTLVDRIVPGFPRQKAEALWQELGYQDDLLVQGEWYHQWIIAGPASAAAEFPVPQTDLNVHFVPDVTPYRNLKVRILNGAHTAMTPIGHLAGLETVLQVMEDEKIGRYIHDLLWQEILPTLDFPPAEREQYATAVLDRFRNPHLRHRLLDIALNSSAKFPARLLPSLLAYHTLTNQLPQRIIFALAALLHLYRLDPLPMRDDPATVAWLQQLWLNHPAGPTLAHSILARTQLWGQDLTAVPGLVEQLGYHLQQIEGKGIRHSLEQEQDNFSSRTERITDNDN